MCRWLAYSGPPVEMSTLLTCPNHSLIDQSVRSRDQYTTTNGDGFGVGWYGVGHSPGTFHDTHPAWNNANLQHLARHVRSPLFLAHVRATSGSAVQNSNCHPFAYENWLFQHNGSIPEFLKVKRELLFEVDPQLFQYIQGSTDSEILFYLALTYGLRTEPKTALQRMVHKVESLRNRAGIKQAFYLSASLTDGERIFAVRYSSDADSPTLYHSRHIHALKSLHESYINLDEDAVVVLSEPVDDISEHWQAVAESTLLTIEHGVVSSEPFQPVALS